MRLVDTSGLEPPTPTMSRWCSNQTELRVYRINKELYRIVVSLRKKGAISALFIYLTS